MKKSYIEKSLTKYIRFEVSEKVAIQGSANFEHLLEYIGENMDFGREYYVGNAFIAIRKRTDEILGVSNLKISKLRTSKTEVKSIRQCFKKINFRKKGKYLMKIPFKVTYIFEAIISLVEDISQEKPIPQDLLPLVGLSYGVAFYKKYIDEYSVHIDEIRNDFIEDPLNPTLKCRVELQNDFTAISSPFMVIF